MSKGQVYVDCLRMDKSTVRLGLSREHFTLKPTGLFFRSWHVGYKWGFIVMHGDCSSQYCAPVLYVLVYDLTDNMERLVYCNLYNGRPSDELVTGQKSGLLLV